MWIYYMYWIHVSPMSTKITIYLFFVSKIDMNEWLRKFIYLFSDLVIITHVFLIYV